MNMFAVGTGGHIVPKISENSVRHVKHASK